MKNIETSGLKTQRNHAIAQSIMEMGIVGLAGLEMIAFSGLAAYVNMLYLAGVFVMMGTGTVAIDRAQKMLNVAEKLEKQLTTTNLSSH